MSSLVRAWDHLSVLSGPAGDLTRATTIIESLRLDEFDVYTIGEAIEAVEAMLAAAQAAHRAGVNAHQLLEVAREF